MWKSGNLLCFQQELTTMHERKRIICFKWISSKSRSHSQNTSCRLRFLHSCGRQARLLRQGWHFLQTFSIFNSVFNKMKLTSHLRAIKTALFMLQLNRPGWLYRQVYLSRDGGGRLLLGMNFKVDCWNVTLCNCNTCIFYQIMLLFKFKVLC